MIECQGEQHFKPVKWYGGKPYFDRLQQHDEIKRKFVKTNGYRLIELGYKNVLYEDVVKFLKDNFVN